MTARAALLAILVLAGPTGLPVPAAGAEEPAPGAAAEAIRVTGSGYTMPRFTRRWADAVRGTRGLAVEIEGTGTSTGPPALLDGRADIASMTRPMNKAELTAFRRRHGVEPVAIPVAADALAVFVNEANPLGRLTLAQVDAVFSKTRACGSPTAISRWGELGLEGEWRARSISLYGRRPGSGTGTYFRSVALCGGEYRNWMRINPGGESAARAVAESRYAIGFGSRTDRRDGMKTLALSRGDGGPWAVPEGDAVYDGSYPLARRLWFYVVKKPSEPLPPQVLAFLEFALSRPAQDVVEEEGFLRVPPETAAEALAAVR